jgi:hypothetical protein
MRHYNEGPKADKWYEINQEGTASWDLCTECSSCVAGNPATDFGLPEGPNGDPLDTVSDGESVIDYGESAADGHEYECDICGCTLTSEDA